MNRTYCAWLCGMLAFGVVRSSAAAQPAPVTPPPATAPAGDTPASDPAREFFEKGTADLTAGKFADAAEKLRAAWKQKQSHDVAGNLGAALLKLGDYAGAARFLSYAVEHHPVGGKPSVKKWTEELLGEAKTKVAEVRLRLTGDAPSPVIRVDGALIEPALVGTSIFVAGGKRVIEASANGYQTAQRTIDVKEGQAVDVSLALLTASPTERSLLAPMIAFGVGGAGLVAGAIAGGIAAAQMANVKGICGPQLDCPESMRGQVDDATTISRVSTVGFVVAGLGAVVGTTLLLIPAKSRTGPGVSVVVGPSFVAVKGAF